MKLIQALRIGTSSRVSLVGSGGKTSTITRLSLEWPSVSLVSTTTHLGKNQMAPFPKHIVWIPGKNNEDDFDVTTLITGEDTDGRLIGGVPGELWPDLEKAAEKNGVPIFIESDGSKTRPIKAPASHEPAIPPWVNHVVVSIGLSVIGFPLNETNVHRPEIFSALTGLDLGDEISFEAVEKMLLHPSGGLKNMPVNARRTVLLNQWDTLKNKTGLKRFEQNLLKKYDSVVIASLLPSKETDFDKEVIQVNENIAGIILAAGASHRMGQPKALMDWHGTPFVRICVLTAISAGLDPVLVIAGEETDRIREALQGLPVEVVQNSDWNEGQSTSIKAGIKTCPEGIGGAVFLLVDQPQIPATLVRKLVTEHSTTLASIILPESGGRRANPALFDRRTFPSLMDIRGDVGGKAIFSKFQVNSIPWVDESILIDVDTPEDYKNLAGIE